MKTSLYNPFERWDSNILLYIGIAITIIGSYFGYVLLGRFDGFLDLHFVNRTTIYQPLLDNLINLMIGATLLYLLGKWINPKTRWIDLLNAVMISRIFIYITLIFNIDQSIKIASDELVTNLPHIEFNANFMLIIAMGIVSLIFLSLSILTLFLGFKVATNSKKLIHVLYFVMTILLIEICTSLLISQLEI